ncbi:MAG TPA: hypothetical protein VNI57_00950, partial [Candidatus Saccharimonadales bacterium]|nr:hypothetical protein [Candidatus Saccharimonadales bacterium]
MTHNVFTKNHDRQECTPGEPAEPGGRGGRLWYRGAMSGLNRTRRSPFGAWRRTAPAALLIVLCTLLAA